MHAFKYCCLFFLGATIAGCGAVRPYYSDSDWNKDELTGKPVKHTVYLIGDAGDLQKEDPIGNLLHELMGADEAGTGSVIFLGDNIYHHGLPEAGDPERKEKEVIINNQINLIQDYSGNTFFIPGNHDWNDSGESGLQAIRRQEEYVEGKLNGQNTFVPDNGCPGPFVQQLADSVLLVVLDSQWWLHKYEVAGVKDGCAANTKEEMEEKLAALINSGSGQQILLAAHHPILTNGVHGGRFGVMDHLFPLRNVKKYLYIPLPVIGSIYPLARMSGVSRQDTPNKVFKRYAATIRRLMELNPGMIYVSGHDHNLQLIQKEGITQIVSGAGSKINYASPGHGAQFVYQGRGFSRLLYLEGHEVWVEFYASDAENDEGTMFYREKLR